MFDFWKSIFENCSGSERLQEQPVPEPDPVPWYFKVFAPDPPETTFTVAQSKLDIILRFTKSEMVSGPYFELKVDLTSFVLFYYSEITSEIDESGSKFKSIIETAITNGCDLKDISCLMDLPHKLNLRDILAHAIACDNVLIVEYLISHCVSNGHLYPFDFNRSTAVHNAFRMYLENVNSQLDAESKELYSATFPDTSVSVSEPEQVPDQTPSKEILDEEALMERIQNLELLMTNFGVPIFTAYPRTQQPEE